MFLHQQNGQHRDSNSASDADSSNTKTDAYEHGYNVGFDTGAVYATGYSDRHADGQDAMILLDDEPNCEWGRDDGSYNNNDW